MGSTSLPSPPAEEQKSNTSRKTTPPGAKMTKPLHRVSKRASSSASTIHHHDHLPHSTGMDSRHKRVWKACERCRMKKTKCDGEFPCKRCKDDGLVCTAGVRKKIEYKQLPRGYAEVLENTQLALIATVHKLYAMVRNNQTWDLGEPELNDRGQPVIHDIAHKLGSIRPNSDIDLPVQSVFPEDEAGMAELARQLEEQQKEQDRHLHKDIKDTDSSSGHRTERASSSDLDHSDFEHDYRKAAFGSSNVMTLSPQSFAGSHDFEFTPQQQDIDPAAMFPSHSPTMPNFPTWSMPKMQQQQQQRQQQHQPQQQHQQQHQQQRQPTQAETDLAFQFLQQNGTIPSLDMLNQGLMESDFGTIKPHVLSCPNPEVMLGMGDPMIYSGYDGEPMRL